MLGTTRAGTGQIRHPFCEDHCESLSSVILSCNKDITGYIPYMELLGPTASFHLLLFMVWGVREVDW